MSVGDHEDEGGCDDEHHHDQGGHGREHIRSWRSRDAAWRGVFGPLIGRSAFAFSNRHRGSMRPRPVSIERHERGRQLRRPTSLGYREMSQDDGAGEPSLR
jgi:hypothetical protein